MENEKALTYVLFTAKHPNETLAAKTVHSVEPGHTPGWLVIHFAPPTANSRLYMTVWCGGIRKGLDPEHDWDIALHQVEGRGDDRRHFGNVIYRSHRPEGPEICDETDAQFLKAAAIVPFTPDEEANGEKV